MDLSTIRTDARYAVNPQLTSTEYPDADLDRNANAWYRKAVGIAVVAGDDWQIGGDVIYRDFKNGVTDYDLPTGLLRVLKGEALYSTGGSYVPITFIDQGQNQKTVEGNTTRDIDDASRPTADLLGTNIIVRPAQTTGADIVNGLRLTVQMVLADLVDTSDEPLLLEPIQRFISKGAAFDFCMSEEMFTKAREIKYEIFGDPRVKDDAGIVGEIKGLYSIRASGGRDQLSARRRSYK